MKTLEQLDMQGKRAYEAGRYREAVDCALAIRGMGAWQPGLAFTTAQCLHIVGRTPEALPILEELCAHFPENAEYAFYLSVCLRSLGEFERSFELVKDLPEFRQEVVSHKSYYFLRRGEILRGHEIMQSAERFTPLEKTFPELDPARRYHKGMSLRGKRLLLVQENGLGDAVMSSRFIETYQRLGADVVVNTSPLLFPLLATLPLPPSAYIPSGVSLERISYDHYLPDSSSEHLLVLGDSSPVRGRSMPYLRSNPSFVEKWQSVIDSHAGKTPKVAVHWHATQTSPDVFHPRDIPFENMVSLLPVGSLYSFQRGRGEAEIQGSPEIFNLGPRFTSLEDTAGALESMDYVVTGCAFLAHLAGAMGKKTALLASLDPHYTWIGEGDTSDWYPSVRIFRQKVYREWDDPVRAVYRWIQEDSKTAV